MIRSIDDLQRERGALLQRQAELCERMRDEKKEHAVEGDRGGRPRRVSPVAPAGRDGWLGKGQGADGGAWGALEREREGLNGELQALEAEMGRLLVLREKQGVAEYRVPVAEGKPLGIEYEDAPQEGVVLSTVAPWGTACRSGLAPGCVVVGVNGNAVTDGDAFHACVTQARLEHRRELVVDAIPPDFTTSPRSVATRGRSQPKPSESWWNGERLQTVSPARPVELQDRYLTTLPPSTPLMTGKPAFDHQWKSALGDGTGLTGGPPAHVHGSVALDDTRGALSSEAKPSVQYKLERFEMHVEPRAEPGGGERAGGPDDHLFSHQRGRSQGTYRSLNEEFDLAQQHGPAETRAGSVETARGTEQHRGGSREGTVATATEPPKGESDHTSPQAVRAVDRCGNGRSGSSSSSCCRGDGPRRASAKRQVPPASEAADTLGGGYDGGPPAPAGSPRSSFSFGQRASLAKTSRASSVGSFRSSPEAGCPPRHDTRQGLAGLDAQTGAQRNAAVATLLRQMASFLERRGSSSPARDNSPRTSNGHRGPPPEMPGGRVSSPDGRAGSPGPDAAAKHPEEPAFEARRSHTALAFSPPQPKDADGGRVPDEVPGRRPSARGDGFREPQAEEEQPFEVKSGALLRSARGDRASQPEIFEGRGDGFRESQAEHTAEQPFEAKSRDLPGSARGDRASQQEMLGGKQPGRRPSEGGAARQELPGGQVFGGRVSPPPIRAENAAARGAPWAASAPPPPWFGGHAHAAGGHGGEGGANGPHLLPHASPPYFVHREDPSTRLPPAGGPNFAGAVPGRLPGAPAPYQWGRVIRPGGCDHLRPEAASARPEVRGGRRQTGRAPDAAGVQPLPPRRRSSAGCGKGFPAEAYSARERADLARRDAEIEALRRRVEIEKRERERLAYAVHVYGSRHEADPGTEGSQPGRAKNPRGGKRAGGRGALVDYLRESILDEEREYVRLLRELEEDGAQCLSAPCPDAELCPPEDPDCLSLRYVGGAGSPAGATWVRRRSRSPAKTVEELNDANAITAQRLSARLRALERRFQEEADGTPTAAGRRQVSDPRRDLAVVLQGIEVNQHVLLECAAGVKEQLQSIKRLAGLADGGNAESKREPEGAWVYPANHASRPECQPQRAASPDGAWVERREPYPSIERAEHHPVDPGLSRQYAREVTAEAPAIPGRAAAETLWPPDLLSATAGETSRPASSMGKQSTRGGSSDPVLAPYPGMTPPEAVPLQSPPLQYASAQRSRSDGSVHPAFRPLSFSLDRQSTARASASNDTRTPHPSLSTRTPHPGPQPASNAGTDFSHYLSEPVVPPVRKPTSFGSRYTPYSPMYPTGSGTPFPTLVSRGGVEEMMELTEPVPEIPTSGPTREGPFHRVQPEPLVTPASYPDERSSSSARNPARRPSTPRTLPPGHRSVGHRDPVGTATPPRLLSSSAAIQQHASASQGDFKSAPRPPLAHLSQNSTKPIKTTGHVPMRSRASLVKVP
eukprot:gene7587-11615_t